MDCLWGELYGSIIMAEISDGIITPTRRLSAQKISIWSESMIDFTNCRVIPGRAYNGANGSKIAVEYNGEAYMLKFPPSAEGKPTDLSYTNSCISEHIASSIFNMLGIRAQETMLGTYTVKGKEKLVCACKDFTAGGKRLLDFLLHQEHGS